MSMTESKDLIKFSSKNLALNQMEGVEFYLVRSDFEGNWVLCQNVYKNETCFVNIIKEIKPEDIYKKEAFFKKIQELRDNTELGDKILWSEMPSWHPEYFD